MRHKHQPARVACVFEQMHLCVFWKSLQKHAIRHTENLRARAYLCNSAASSQSDLKDTPARCQAVWLFAETTYLTLLVTSAQPTTTNVSRSILDKPAWDRKTKKKKGAGVSKRNKPLRLPRTASERPMMSQHQQHDTVVDRLPGVSSVFTVEKFSVNILCVSACTFCREKTHYDGRNLKSTNAFVYSFPSTLMPSYIHSRCRRTLQISDPK